MSKIYFKSKALASNKEWLASVKELRRDRGGRRVRPTSSVECSRVHLCAMVVTWQRFVCSVSVYALFGHDLQTNNINVNK